MLYTGKGDKGTTKLFGCDQRFLKSSAVAEALGTVDELNSFLGLCKAHARKGEIQIKGKDVHEIVGDVQQNLFIIQAELAGADKHMVREKVTDVEDIINTVEKAIPPVNSFFVPGATELGAFFDVARTIARRAERRIVAHYLEKDETTMGYGQDQSKQNLEIREHTLAYINRLSSLLYALARFANHTEGSAEEKPHY